MIMAKQGTKSLEAKTLKYLEECTFLLTEQCTTSETRGNLTCKTKAVASVEWYRGNWRLCELHKYYVKHNNSLFPLARYRETSFATGVVRGGYFSVSSDNYSSVSVTVTPRCQRQLLLVDSEVQMNLEAWSAGLYFVSQPIA